MIRISMELQRNIFPIIPMRNTSMSTRLPGIAMAIRIVLRFPTGIGAYGIELDQPLIIIWRIYLEKATKTGPSSAEIAYDRAIKFDPKK